MPTFTGRNTRTITGYVITLLEYPRWIIEREVDFTNCHHGGTFDSGDAQCTSCGFGEACCWLNSNRNAPPLDAPLPELVLALDAAVVYLRSRERGATEHTKECDCDDCQWLREAMSFLRLHRHKA